MIKIVLVDDHAVVRSGLRLLLDAEDDMEVVGEAGNAKDAIFRARALKPDVILLDVVMPGESGIEVLPMLLRSRRRRRCSSSRCRTIPATSARPSPRVREATC